MSAAIRKRLWLAVPAAAAALLIASASGVQPAGASTSTATFNAVADAYVNQQSPKTNFGTQKQLKLDSSPIQQGYVRFNVTGLSGTILSATLKLRSQTTTSTGYDVRGVANNTWGETTITYNNAPAPSGTITASSGALTSGQTSSINITPLVTGNGVISVALTTTNASGINLASRESGGATVPQLVVQTTTDVAPVNTSPPTISGTAQAGQVLTASTGTWTGTSPTYAYQWRRCDTSGNNCSNITGATSQSYTVAAADVGSTLRIAVTASNSAGSATASSAQTPVVASAPAAPTNTSPPTISGTAQVGQVMTAANGSWSGTAPISFAYQWRRCDTGGNNCTNISGATAQSYTAVAADAGTTLRVSVTASNSVGSSTASSAQTGVVSAAATAPANTSPPTVSGTAQAGQVLNASTGSWSGTAPISYTYQWRRCDSSGANCADIFAATSQSYTLGSLDIGSTIRVAITASNSAGSSSATSAQTGVVSAAASAPANTSPPTISGTAQVGQVLTAANGSWSGTTPISFAYQWRRCDSGGANCADIAGATAQSYTAVAADAGSTLRVAVTASNSVGSSSAASAQTGVVSAAATAPVNTSLPTASGTAQVGQTLSADPGSWSGTAPISFAYQWRRCDSSGANCADIAGANGQTYVLAAADGGSSLRVAVTASNSAGSGSAVSAQTAVVGAAQSAPSNTSPPTVSGTAQVGQTLSADPGAWSGTTPISFAFQWRRCDSGGANCADIAGATAQTYLLVAADVGSTLRVAVTGSNSVGSSGASSAQTSVVSAASTAPVNTSPPTVSGTAQVGQTLSADPGAWSGTTPISFAFQWRRCDSGGANCADIAGATAQSYTAVAGDVGSTLMVAVTASNSAGSGSASSAQTGVVSAPASAPVNTSAPTVSGTAQVGQVLSADPGSWSGTAPISYAYHWRRCDTGGNNCSDISGATAQSYAAVAADAGSTLRVAVTATNGAGSGSSSSAQTAVVGAAQSAPSNSSVPTVSGTAQVGQTLSADPGSWSGTAPISFAYQWRRCDSGGANCADIAGATAQTYLLVAADVGSTLRVAVTGSNAVGSSTAASVQTGVVSAAATAPVNTSLPTVSGTAQVGQVLSASPGVWSGTAPILFAYQWRRCDSAGANCGDIAGATGQSYTAAAADTGSTLVVAVTASNSVGSGSASSAQTAVVAAAPAAPSNTALPSVSGTAQAGQVLSADPGLWSGTAPISFAYQWRRCDSAGANCSDIGGATSQSYTAVGADAGSTLRVAVTATNGVGSASVVSAQTAVVGAAPTAPSNTSQPTVSGTAQVGQTMSADPGSWSGTAPISFAYQWRRCDSGGANCADIAGATAQTYLLVAADVGSTLRVAVTGSNSVGSSSASSVQTGVVSAAATAPVNTSAPTVSGTAQAGQVLSAGPGLWSGTAPISFAYQWRRCDSAGANCSDIGGATSQSYTAVAADVGSTLLVAVTASNSVGSGSASSAQTAVVAAAPVAPSNTTLPTVSGTAQAGQLLSADPGLWSGTAPISFAYQWRRCDSSGANCADIASATLQSYTASASDVGSTIRVAVTASNSVGSTSTSSAHTAVVVAAPVAPSNTSLPAISGTAQAGQLLSADPGSWSGTAPIGYSYQWRQCDSSGANCSDISGAASQSYTPVAADVGSTLRVTVTGSNSVGSSTASSAQTAVVVAAPVAPSNTALPTISGSAQAGQALSADPGSWSGTAPISFAFQWQRCDSGGANCSDISGATSQSYTAVAADVGSTLQVAVTGSNSVGSSSASSAQTVAVAAAPVAPSNTSSPTVSGTAQAGQSLSADPGVWSGTAPISYAYQWRRCDTSGNSCTDISGAASQSYTLGAADVGSTLRVAVTGSNSVGSSTAASAQTSVVAPAPAAPSNTAAPTISGTAQAGQVLSADPGSWSGTAPISYTYQWQHCDTSASNSNDPSTSNCTDISGVTSQSHTATEDDVGWALRVVVTASNSVGSSSTSSAWTAVVAPPPVGPSNTSPPAITGTAQAGQTLSAGPGVWSGTAPISYAYEWQRCDTGGGSCVDIFAASGQTYALTLLDVGSTIRVIVAASNSVGSTTASSSPTAVVAAAPVPPSNSSPPAISGTAQAGQVLSANPGFWSGTAPISYAYQWQRCDTSGNNCTNISGATSQSYTAVAADVGSTLRVAVTATNSVGATTASSSPTGVVTAAPVPPSNTSSPAISGVAQAGQVLSADPGSWSGTAPITGTYQWQRCDTGGSNCGNISGATSETYTAVAADVGSTIRVVVTATNSAGSSSASSDPTEVVAPAPVAPSNSSPPSISGTAQAGQLLSADPGVWSGTAPISYTYQWQRCDTGGANCADIFAAAGQTYTLGPLDVGSTIRVTVTASNSVGSSTASSSQTAVVSPAPTPPSNTSLPTISGTAQAGQLLSADPGSWSGTAPISYAYQWQRCDTSGNNCGNISGATSQSYTAVAADVGSTIRVAVTATNSAGSGNASSAQTAVVAAAPAPPSNTSLPTISGTAKAGQVLTATQGTWSGTQPISYTYQWRRCDTGGANCADISSATGQTYTLGSLDVGSAIRVVVTATNSVGSSNASSAQTAVVTTSSGCTPRSSSYSQAVSGTSGVVAYWRLGESSGTVACDSVGSNNGSYQTGTTLGQPGGIANDPDTAVGFNGTSGWVSVPSNASLNVGDRFSIEAWVKRGSLGGTANQVIASKQAGSWVLMFNPSNQLVLRQSGTSDLVVSTAKVTDTTAWHYVAATKDGAAVHLYLDGADVTGTVTNVTMTNNTQPLAIGQSSGGTFFNGSIDEVALYNLALSAAQVVNHYGTGAPGQAPANVTLPTISGTAQGGQTLTATPGSWTGTPPLSYTYQWRRCDSTGANCVDIAGATAQAYTLTAADPGFTIRVVVTASNSTGSASATSAATAVVGVGSTCSPRSSTYSNAVLGTTGVVSYWRLGESSGQVACDSTGSNYGFYQSGTTLGQPGAIVGDPDTAVGFNGTSGWVSVAQSTSLNVGDRFSIEAWVKRGSLGGTANQVIASKQTGAWSLMFNMSNQLVLRKSGTADVVTSTAKVTDTTAWHYVVATKDGAVTHLYLDGADVTGTVTNQTMTDNTQPLAIGQSSGATFYNGSIDEVALYNLALTSAQVSTHYADGAPNQPPVNLGVPTISGTTQTGQTLTAAPGSWSGTQPMSFAYQWRRCDSTGANCVDIAGATTSTYTVVATDGGSTLRVAVTAANGSGSASATSAQTATVPFAGCAPRSSSYSQAVLGTAGVAAYWRLGESSGTVACDSAGSNNGSYVTGTTLGQQGAIANDPDTAVAFNGTSGWVSVPSNASLNVGDRFSIEAWVKRGSIGGSSNQVIASKQTGAWSLMFNASNQLVLRKSGAADVVTSTAKVTDTTAWHYVAATKDGAVVHLYLDGADVTGPVTNQTMTDNTQPLAIGQSSSSTFFNGSIDEVALYNVAISAAQVSNHYGIGAPGQPPVNLALPTISGTAQAGQTLTASPGAWAGTPPLAYAFQWSRCITTGVTCAPIAGATGSTYVVTNVDVGAVLNVGVTASNNAGSANATSNPTAPATAASSPPGDPVIAAAGDIACDPASLDFNNGLGTPTACEQQATSNLLVGQNYSAVLALGDDQYYCGGYNAFLQSYDPSWGRVKSITHPVPGNHEYLNSNGTDCDPTGQAAGYYQYFGAAAGDPTKGYYSFDIGSWHVVALNSNCAQVGGCGAGSAQETWLKADLATHVTQCTLAFWHHPRFSSGEVGNDAEMATVWQDLYNSGVDLVLNGHAHGYERFGPQDPSQHYDPTSGIREIVVGTGGEDFQSFPTPQPLSENRQSSTFGVLSLTLHANSYDWQFVPIAGKTYSDSGTTFCH